MDLRNTIFGFLNSLKAYTGQVKGLHDPVKIAKRRDHERRFQAAIEADPGSQGRVWGADSPYGRPSGSEAGVRSCSRLSSWPSEAPSWGPPPWPGPSRRSSTCAPRARELPPEMVDQMREAMLQPRPAAGRSTRANLPSVSRTSCGTTDPIIPSYRSSSRVGRRKAWRL